MHASPSPSSSPSVPKMRVCRTHRACAAHWAATQLHCNHVRLRAGGGGWGWQLHLRTLVYATVVRLAVQPSSNWMFTTWLSMTSLSHSHAQRPYGPFRSASVTFSTVGSVRWTARARRDEQRASCCAACNYCVRTFVVDQAHRYRPACVAPRDLIQVPTLRRVRTRVCMLAVEAAGRGTLWLVLLQQQQHQHVSGAPHVSPVHRGPATHLLEVVQRTKGRQARKLAPDDVR